jgi:L-ascorbate metabolism protein UlaG (beta-lactamase superfamily)
VCLACVSMGASKAAGTSSRRQFLTQLGAAGALASLGAVAPAPARAVQPIDATPEAGTASAIDRFRRAVLPTSDGPPGDGAVAVTFLGTTSLLFDDGETRLLIDGFVSRPSLEQVLGEAIATDRAAVDAASARLGVDRVEALFVAHSHWDHALDVAYVAEQTGAHLYGSESTLNIGRGGGLAEEQMSRFELGTPLPFGRFTVTVLPSKHSPPLPGVNDDLGKVIAAPLRQPAPVSAYVEGGSFDFLIAHGDHAILVKPSANYIDGALDGLRADVLFLATATLGSQDEAFQNAFYEQSVGAVQPELVIPVHWDNFFLPLSDHLDALDPADLTASFDFLIDRLAADGREFGVMQGYQTMLLFAE